MESIDDVIAKLKQTLEKDIDGLTPRQRVQLWLDLQEYKKPKLSRKEKIIKKPGGAKQTIIFGQMKIEF